MAELLQAYDFVGSTPARATKGHVDSYVRTGLGFERVSLGAGGGPCDSIDLVGVLFASSPLPPASQVATGGRGMDGFCLGRIEGKKVWRKNTFANHWSEWYRP